VISALDHYRPTRSTAVLVAALNRLYHEFEANGYESNHPEIFEQLPPIWREMFAQSLPLLGPPERKLRILDFGCGTGFEARQCLAELPSDRIERLVCYDPSEEMLYQCRQGLKHSRHRVEFLSDPDELEQAGRFDVLITNSVLHHMVDPTGTIRDMARLLSPCALWLCGHEPSRRFWGNPECRELLRRYRRAQRLRRWVNPYRYARKLTRWVGLSELPEEYAARRAFEEAIFERRPPAGMVGSLVDYHVLSSERELTDNRGLDFENLATGFAGEWEPVWRKSYSFLGPHYEGAAPRSWRSNARQLAERFPDDGANCCLLWRRVSARH
jgi:SAM-dependent methyltransferase